MKRGYAVAFLALVVVSVIAIFLVSSNRSIPTIYMRSQSPDPVLEVFLGKAEFEEDGVFVHSYRQISILQSDPYSFIVKDLDTGWVWDLTSTLDQLNLHQIQPKVEYVRFNLSIVELSGQLEITDIKIGQRSETGERILRDLFDEFKWFHISNQDNQ